MTVAYFDTSALIPLIVEEAASASCDRLWRLAERRVSSVVVWPEAASALAKAHRLGRLDDDGLRDSIADLERVINECELRNVDRECAESAAGVALRLGLRGFDAVHVDTALQLGGEDFVAVTGDRAMASAWDLLGVPSVDVNAG